MWMWDDAKSGCAMHKTPCKADQSRAAWLASVLHNASCASFCQAKAGLLSALDVDEAFTRSADFHCDLAILIYKPAHRCEPGRCTQLHCRESLRAALPTSEGRQTTRDDHAPAQEARGPQNRRQEA